MVAELTGTNVPSTADVITQMLTENTGIALCDSGGAYGRNWEHNQGKAREDFENAPAATLRFGQYGIEATLDIFHFLVDAFDGCYCPQQQELFEAWADSPEHEDQSWYENMHEWPEHFAKSLGSRLREEPMTVNTYNGNDMVSQVMQYTSYTIDDPRPLDPDNTGNVFILLQIHGGCDVRGGYTKPRIFHGSAYDFPSVAQARIEVEKQPGSPDSTQIALFEDKSEAALPPAWCTDDAYNFYPDSNFPGLKKLAEYELTDDPDERGKGKLYYDEEGNGYCPHTGGKLILLP